MLWEQLCKDELQQLRARRVLHADAKEQMLSREFAGNLMANSPVLTYSENSADTLTPQQARYSLCFVDRMRAFGPFKLAAK